MKKIIPVLLIAAIIIVVFLYTYIFTPRFRSSPYCIAVSDESITQIVKGVFGNSTTIEKIQETYCNSGVSIYKITTNVDGHQLEANLTYTGGGLELKWR